MIKILVCGGRNYADREALYAFLDNLNTTEGPIGFVIHGDARGADRMGRDWAIARGIGSRAFPADWNEHGNSAGPIRNQQMLDQGQPDLVVAFAGGNGTADMVRRAIAAGVKVIEV